MFFLSLFLTSQVMASTAQDKKTVSMNCYSTREFITTMEFLRDHKEFALTPMSAQKLAESVSGGCSGSSKRFIQITGVLLKAGIPSNRAIEVAQQFALKSEAEGQTFLTTFKGAFIENLLDLDASHALELALEVSKASEKNPKLAEKNFNQLVDFCVKNKGLDLPLLECGRMGARVLKNATDFEFSVTQDFISLFEYLTDKRKANLPTFEALKAAEYVSQFGPEAKNNFVQAFEYAVKKQGLDKSIADGVEFAKSMAAKSIKMQ